MRYIKWTLIAVFWLIVAGFLHYTLPQTDVVRITDTYEKRVDFGLNRWFYTGGDAGSGGGAANRDVFFIQTIRADGAPMIYRNEDTGWGWPPYFKFDSANLQAEAADYVSKKSDPDPQWVAMRHYGWRNEFLSIYPNALAIRPVPGPDWSPGIPWFNIAVLTVLFAVFWAIRVRWRRFRRARIDPVLEDVSDSIWEAGQDARDRGGRLRRWLGRLTGRE